MSLISMHIDMSGVKKNMQKMIHELTSKETIGRQLYLAASQKWVPNITDRLMNTHTSWSGYQYELPYSLSELDPEFVNLLGNSSGWADQTEAQRRTKDGYKQGEITNAIRGAIQASQPIEEPGYIFVGIGEYNRLDNVYTIAGANMQYKIWQILQWGTGVYGPYGSPVVRKGKQIFFHRAFGTAVMTEKTVNPGFRGREFFVQLDGSIHMSDYETVDMVMSYIVKIVKEYSGG